MNQQIPVLPYPPGPSPGRRNVKLTLAYDGTDFHGWQHQRGLRTIQQTVAATLSRLMREPTPVYGASRTDAGVHAKGQVANASIRDVVSCDRLQRALNHKLPHDVVILEARNVAPTFSARFSAISKWYRYTIDNPPIRDPQRRNLAYYTHKPLDTEAMEEAAAKMVGTHDFRGFARMSDKRPSVRRIYRVALKRDGSIITIDVEGNGFLHNMVRTMAGTLMDIGLGYFAPERIDHILRSGHRPDAGMTAPAHGLCLMAIRYDHTEL